MDWVAFVRPSVRLFPLYLLNWLTFELDFLYVFGTLGYGHISPRTKGRDNRAGLKVSVQRVWA